MQPEKPIGFWIRQADELLTKGIDQVQASLGFTRTKWQILHAIFESTSLSSEGLATLMAPFADQQAVERIIAVWQAENIVAADPANLITLTDKGRLLHEQCFEQQQAFRQKAMAGITPQDYRTTLLTLQQIAGNIGRQGEGE